MNVSIFVEIAKLSLALLEKLAPLLEELAKGGHVTAEEQKELQDKINTLRSREPFKGPEWELKPDISDTE